jgi:phage baseplate assembly protein W
MASLDFRDLYIKYNGHPKFRSNRIIEDDLISVMIQKYELLLFTNKGELLGQPEFGCNLEELLFQTKVSSEFVEETINSQIVQFIPEMASMNYRLRVEFVRDYQSYQEAMIIYFTIADYEVYARVGDRYDASF